MDASIQIQSLKSQMENMKLQVDNIQIQNYNIPLMNNQIGEQILNLSIQLFNAGIQAFNMGRNMIMLINNENFYEQLKKISERINSMISFDIQQKIMQQQIMQQQMIQQPMMQSQIIQQPMIQQKKNERPAYITVSFKLTNGNTINITVDSRTTIEELLKKFIAKDTAFQNGRINFIFNGEKINMNEKKTVIDFFKYNYNPKIMVMDY